MSQLNRYEFVGSFLRPERLKEARKNYELNNITKEELTKVEDECIVELVNKLKELGYHTITDGEFRRSTWHLDFMWGFDGVSHTPTKTGLPFHGEAAMIDDTYITGKVGVSGTHPFVEHFKFLTQFEDENTIAKQTIPAPAQFLEQMILPFALENTKKYYEDTEELVQDIAKGYKVVIQQLYDAGCRCIQFDDCSWGMLVDEKAPLFFQTDQEGLLKAQNYQKYTFHGNLQHSFNKWLTVGANTQFTYSIQDVFDSALIDIYRYGWPTENVKNEDDTYNISSMHNTYILYPWNPVLDMNETTTQFTTNRFLGTLFAEMQLMKDLKYRLNLGVDLKNTRKYNYVGSESAVNKASGLKGNGYNNWNKRFSKVMENILTYNHTWNKHRLTATAVYSWQDFTYEDINLSGSGFENDLTGAWSMGLADKSSVSWGTNKYSNKLISFTGRVSYVYDDKYLLTATSRWDGSSRFGANNKWGYFPSVGLGWRLSQESFLKENKVITNLKIRGSFGITGNQEIGNYKSLAQLTGSNYTDGSSVIYGFKESIGNGDLKWERTTQFDLGFDLSLWNRIDIAFDYYTRNTNDLLYNVPIPSTSGYSSILSNIGKVTNKGWEFSIGGNIMQNKDFNLYASVNVTYNQNKIKELYGGVDEVAVRYEAGGLARVLKVGNSVDAIYARHSLGIIKTQEQLDEYKKKVPNTAANAQLGDEMYEDIDGDGSISSNDYVCLGSVQPKYFYGLNLSMEYKGFGLSVYGQGGHKYASIAGAEDYYANNSAWAMSYANLTSYLLYGENQISNNVYIPTQYAYEHMWSPENPNGNYPTAGAHDVYLSDRTNANWKYFILRNIQFNYDLAPLLNIKSVKSLKVNLNFQNFVTFANHRGYNPINGDTSNPWAKSIILGINAKF